ncbi:hypothetical protein [Corynebacterium gerontici]|uniref:Uncharacterized protein n=1 Tax=Corynebacterium gerontici TaxID=2079234 RepID=A0A3G6IZ07_9CORY|nr:hypothetical protein [Corynebacterium gerontici]AZA11025.1 hypothetical protein CGERO_03530 [Corynebacterium gerontici]
MPRRQRRFAQRVSPEDYDRSAEEKENPDGLDELRTVRLGEEELPQTEEQFWREQRPPHYGGDI